MPMRFLTSEPNFSSRKVFLRNGGHSASRGAATISWWVRRPCRAYSALVTCVKANWYKTCLPLTKIAADLLHSTAS